MQRLKLLALAALAGSLAAQSNTVSGLDGRIVSIDQLTYQGRRGAAYPNGEIGLSMLNFMCNPGSVNIPWFAAMSANHPKFGFIITRLSGGRMVQISDWSYVKHAFASVNGSGTCGTCQNPGTSSQMGVHCDDTYQASHNADRYNLGPPSELDPWLGTWNPVGSYFDRGDPPVSASQQVDGVRSLTSTMTSAFDAVKNRITVKEQDLLVPGASYFYGIKLIHQGEAGANRGDNIASRGFNPVGSSTGGGTWTTNNSSAGLLYGSILGQWTGATIDNASNGPDDGFFYVAVSVTGPVAGVYHYEYAVNNVDNNRGGAGLHIPLAPGATVTGLGFRDIDSNALNDWTGTINAAEITFAAPAGNPQNWNTIYNFWFDCNVAPSQGQVLIDEARVGPGQLQVAVNARVPSGIPTASVASIGTGCVDCPRSFYEEFGSPAGMDLGGHTMVLTLNGNNYQVSSGSPTYVAPSGSAVNLGLGDDSRATVNLPFSLPYPGGSTMTLSVCSNGFISPGINNDTTYTPDVPGFLAGVLRWAPAWHDFIPDATHTVMVDSSASVVRVTWNNVPDYNGTGNTTMQVQFLPSGTINVLWQTMSTSGTGYVVGYTPGGGANDPGSSDLTARLPLGFSVCQTESLPLALGSATTPVIGTTIGLNTTNIPAGTQFGGLQLSFAAQVPPTDLTSIGMPGCFSYTQGAFLIGGLWITPGSSHMVNIPIPNQNSLIGAVVYTQSATFGPLLTPLGAIASNGFMLTLGL